MRKLAGRVIISICSLFLLSSCVSTGRNFTSNIDWMKKNKTKKKDVQLVFGEPFAVGNSGGVTTWIYAYYKYNLLGKPAHKELKIYWNKDTSVKNFSYTSSFARELALKK